MEFNFLAILVAAIVPILIGFVWYNPKTIWKRMDARSRNDRRKNERWKYGCYFWCHFVIIFFLAFFFKV